ncbi:MAG TPA: TIGR03118 family protein [Methylomirabilota bacterium]|jgi:uncharacterized protein (TIGR03118 family)
MPRLVHLRRALVLGILATLATAGATAAHDQHHRHRKSHHRDHRDDQDRSPGNAYELRILVVNKPELAQPDTSPIVNPLLLNPWGTAIRPAGAGGHIWLANAGSATVTEYVGDVFDAAGNFIPLFQDGLKVVYVDGSPIGQVFSSSASDFPVTAPACPDSDATECPPGTPDVTVPARFIVSTEEGQIAAWGEQTLATGPVRFRRFVTIVDNAGEGALYRGLAVTGAPSANLLYAANFAQDRIEVYDSQWRRLSPLVRHRFGHFRRFAKPHQVPADYVPFSVHYLAGKVYVAYAQLVQPGDPDFDPEDPIAERACAGCGFVVEFDTDGHHLRTFEPRGRLNAPWGMAIAPRNFGKFSNTLLVGNFGDGTIVGFDRHTGKQIGYLRDPEGAPIVVDGLWGLFFGNGVSLGRADFLYFTAGPNGEEDGVFGSLNWVGTKNPDPVVSSSP